MKTSASGVRHSADTVVERPTTATTWSSRPARGACGGRSAACPSGRAPGRPGSASWYSQPAWFSSEPRWWSTVNDGAADLAGGGAEVDRGLAAVGADLEQRARAAAARSATRYSSSPSSSGMKPLARSARAEQVGGHLPAGLHAVVHQGRCSSPDTMKARIEARTDMTESIAGTADDQIGQRGPGVGVERRPAAGETVLGSDLEVHPGGKGANQAVAAARLGGRVRLAGPGRRRRLRPTCCCDALAAAGVDIVGTWSRRGPTGVALITVDPSGDNSIVVSPGANGRVTEDDVAAAGRCSPPPAWCRCSWRSRCPR